MRTVSAGTNARRQRASLAAGAPRRPACPSLLLLRLLLELVLESTAESPWTLPVVADRSASLAKVVMAELANQKPENKSWPGGTHSLRYHYLTLSEPGPSLPQFLAVGYVDDQPFIQYDSRAGRAEPQAPWMASTDTQYWETETQKHRAWAEVQQVNLWTVMRYYNQSGGIHSTQRMFGCDIQEDSLSSSFWHFGFDGQDHLSLDLETLSWVSAEPVACRPSACGIQSAATLSMTRPTWKASASPLCTGIWSWEARSSPGENCPLVKDSLPWFPAPSSSCW